MAGGGLEGCINVLFWHAKTFGMLWEEGLKNERKREYIIFIVQFFFDRKRCINSKNLVKTDGPKHKIHTSFIMRLHCFDAGKIVDCICH